MEVIFNNFLLGVFRMREDKLIKNAEVGRLWNLFTKVMQKYNSNIVHAEEIQRALQPLHDKQRYSFSEECVSSATVPVFECFSTTNQL